MKNFINALMKSIGYFLIYGVSIWLGIVIVDSLKRFPITLSALSYYNRSYVDVSTEVIIALSSVISILLFYLVFKMEGKNLWKACCFKIPKAEFWVIAVALAIGLDLLSGGFLQVTRHAFKNYASFSESLRLVIHTIPGALTCIIIGPVFEEILFRGIILNELRKEMHTLATVITQAALFSVIHLNAAQLIYAFFMGIVLGFLFICSRSILPGIILHVTYNSIGTIVSPFYIRKFEYFHPYVSMVTGIVIVAALMILVWKRTCRMSSIQ